jgi:hypothetical protein
MLFDARFDRKALARLEAELARCRYHRKRLFFFFFFFFLRTNRNFHRRKQNKQIGLYFRS